MAEEFVSLDEAISITGLSREELEKRIADGTLRSFLQEGKQLLRREDILKLKEESTEEKAPAEEEVPEEAASIMELLEEGEELTLMPEEEETRPEKDVPIEVPGLAEEKEAKEEEAEGVLEADEELKIEVDPEGAAEGPVQFIEDEEEAEEEAEAPTEAGAVAAEVLEEMEEAGEELGEEEVRELAEREEAPAYTRALLQPAVHPGFYFLLVVSIVFLVLSTMTLVSWVLRAPQSIIQPFLRLFTG
jgi:hypothetical protein